MVHHTDRCPLQRHDQSDIMLHRSSPSLRGPHEDGLIRCWRADSLCLRLARSRNYPMLQKSPLRSCRIKIRNNRIGANGFLNQRCALTPDLESILRTQTGKILLQQNLPTGDMPNAFHGEPVSVRLTPSTARRGRYSSVLRWRFASISSISSPTGDAPIRPAIYLIILSPTLQLTAS